jgi:hypothetical protein
MSCTKEQVRLLFKNYQRIPLRQAAAKAGMSINTARKYVRGPVPGVQSAPREYRTRPDHFATHWGEICSLLENDSGLQAKTILEYLVDKYPDMYNESHGRTLRRRIERWHAEKGPGREVFFAQNIFPGRQSQSDWTDCRQLGIKIGGEDFPHLLFHFILPYSGWQSVNISFSESFDSLTAGYMKAVTELGAVAIDHRTDNLTAAVKDSKSPDGFNDRWTAFLGHYNAEPSKNNPGKSNENGAVESRHGGLKNALDQALKLRRSREFRDIVHYRTFLEQFVRRSNARRKAKLMEELEFLLPLPSRHWNDPIECTAAVTPFSAVTIGGSIYSVPSRLIGKILKAMVYPDTIKLFFGPILVQEMPRLAKGERKIDYRHVIGWLVRKPGAFAAWVFRDEFFPSTVFRTAYDDLLKNHSSQRAADKEYLKILHRAALDGEIRVENALAQILQCGLVPNDDLVKVRTTTKVIGPPPIVVLAPDLGIYDALLQSRDLA